MSFKWFLNHKRNGIIAINILAVVIIDGYLLRKQVVKEVVVNCGENENIRHNTSYNDINLYYLVTEKNKLKTNRTLYELYCVKDTVTIYKSFLFRRKLEYTLKKENILYAIKLSPLYNSSIIVFLVVFVVFLIFTISGHLNEKSLKSSFRSYLFIAIALASLLYYLKD